MKFYIIDSPRSHYGPKPGKNEIFVETEWNWYNPKYGDEEICRCPCCGESIVHRFKLPPWHVELEMWSNGFADIAFWASDMLFSERFVELFKSAGLTGLQLHGEVIVDKMICRKGVRRKKLPPMPKYYYATVTDGNTLVNHHLSHTVFEPDKEPTCNYCRSGMIEKIGPIVLDAENWDGSDIFGPRGICGMYCVSERFVRWFHENQINNGRIISFNDYSRDWSGEAISKMVADIFAPENHPFEDLSGDPEDNE